MSTGRINNIILKHNIFNTLHNRINLYYDQLPTIIVPSPPTPPGIGAPHVLAISHVLAIFPFLNH
jgi:hypothetical protein